MGAFTILILILGFFVILQRGGDFNVSAAEGPSASNMSVASEESIATIPLTCSVSASCTSGTTLLKLYDATGGHAGLPASTVHSNRLCCSGLTGLGSSCSGIYDTFLKLYSASDGHVQKKTGTYTNNACISIGNGSVSCTYSSGGCEEGSNCLASISGDGTNSHVGSCATYNTKVCCRISVSTPQDNSSSYCDYYFVDDVLYKGRNGQLDMSFIYTDTDPYATLSQYKIAIGTSSLVGSATVVTGWIGGAAAEPGERIIYDGTWVKTDPGDGDLLYNNTYYWWVKVKNNNLSVPESDWISAGSTFKTPLKHFPLVRVVADRSMLVVNTNMRFCSGTDINNPSDPCYSTCWTGTGSPADPSDADNWKCSVCYDSSGNPASCSTNGNVIQWKIPGTLGTDYSFPFGDDIDSPNPSIKFLSAGNKNIGLSIAGSECGNEKLYKLNLGSLLPRWREISPF